MKSNLINGKNIFGLILMIFIFGVVVHPNEFSSSVEYHTRAPEDINKLFEDFFRETVERDYETATDLGITKDMGFKIRNDKLTDFSKKVKDKEIKLFKRYLHWLNSFEKSTLTKSQNINAEILKWYLKTYIEGDQFRHHDYIINQLTNVHSWLISLMTNRHVLENLKDAKDYISRLEGFKNRYNQLVKDLEIREQMKILPPKFIIEKFEKNISNFRSTPVKENILYTAFKKKIEKLSNITKKDKNNLYIQVENNIKNYVYPSYDKFLAHMKKIKNKTNNNAGVWKLPNGDKYYEFCLKKHTTTNLTAEEIHQIGIKEVKRIQKELFTIFSSLGFKKGADFGEIIGKVYQSLPSNEKIKKYNSKTEKDRQEILKDYQKIVNDVEKELPKLFSLIPKTKVEVKPIPSFKEKFFSGSYYELPSIDQKRKGVFYVNLSRPPQSWQMQTLVYHETIPGHHFQMALQQESGSNNLFRNLFIFTGFTEGWALYIEKLAKEQGWYEGIYSKIGHLFSEHFRAIRLVIDTGIHYKKWTREQAADYMKKNLGGIAYGEIDRYCVYPGQACSYKIGELKILELRKKAKEKLKDKFNIKDFHKVITNYGSMPLQILENLVDEYMNN